MQLTPFKSVSQALATASLTAVIPAQASWFEDDQWQVDSAIMSYAEDGDRVEALEGAVIATRTDGDERTLTLGVTIDSLTGASANGAVEQNQPQSFTRPSGNGSYRVGAGETPLDDTFKDTRLQLNAGWAEALNSQWQYDIGAHLSKEYDYLSIGLNGGIARHFNKKNTTVRFGASVFYDRLEPEGGMPVPLAAMVLAADYDSGQAFDLAFDATRAADDEHKIITEMTVGLTQVINRFMLMQFNYSYANSDGYLTDPFKLVSIVDSSGTVRQNRYESRPNSRNKHALFWQTKVHLGAPIIDISYRFMSDDWQVDSHTADLRVNYLFSNGHYVEPHLRFYTQTDAEFFRPYLTDAESLPTYVSADYRLAQMDTYTIGFKYGIPLAGGDEMALRIEYYQQSPDGGNKNQPGQLANVDLTPEVNAVTLQFSYHYH
ncbi:DUF3570 domain-containing protein [Ferrimonas lipolytica]|uniref:DUF3570 domain-containing protein n=1 Tax=Ferrimonas lipolytica TaxID=2724191 RepID=A0A6H1UCF4_9GAMM|nr:DUF3570 domain-containing protein [Ferrimonas lipolytica]QIZ76724.1 DUF3570 domain-containing protein [Ferrimonas lipolytica]